MRAGGIIVFSGNDRGCAVVRAGLMRGFNGAFKPCGRGGMVNGGCRSVSRCRIVGKSGRCGKRGIRRKGKRLLRQTNLPPRLNREGPIDQNG